MIIYKDMIEELKYCFSGDITVRGENGWIYVTEKQEEICYLLGQPRELSPLRSQEKGNVLIIGLTPGSARLGNLNTALQHAKKPC